MSNISSESVKEAAIQAGADIVGIASVDRFDDEITGYKPTDIIPESKSVISIGVRQLRSYLESAPSTEYFMFGYRVKNDLLNEICWNTARVLDKEGYKSLPIQSYGEGELYIDKTVLPERAERKMKAKAHFRGSFNHKKAAVAAGLGEIGLSGMFLNPEYGPRIHLGSVITTAPLTPDPLFEGNLCDRENCRECVKQCPANAIGEDGKLSDIDCLIDLDKLTTDYKETIKQILERQAKEDPLLRISEGIGYLNFSGIGYCGIPCINACPVGKKELD